jgi:hypothetical protein
MKRPLHALLLFCAGWLLLGAAAPRHAYHVSLTEVTYNAETQALEIAVKLFTDDLEGTLEALGAPRLHLDTPQEHQDAPALIARYLDHRLTWTIDGEARTAKYLGKEYEDDATWCYLEISGLGPFWEFSVRNLLLTERFEDQSNLVHVSVGGRTQSLLLNAQKPTASINF